MTEDIGKRIQEASRSVSAPMALRESLDREPARRPAHQNRLGLASVGLTLAIIATMAALLAPSGPTVQAVAAAVLKAPQRPAPAGNAYLHGYTAVGARTDTVDGRTAKTVIYTRGSIGVHYAIVDGDPLDLPSGKRVRAGRISLARGDHLVAWHANGKTCVLTSKALNADQLAALLRSA
jgi:hypothetical protein